MKLWLADGAPSGDGETQRLGREIVHPRWQCLADRPLTLAGVGAFRDEVFEELVYIEQQAARERAGCAWSAVADDVANLTWQTGERLAEFVGWRDFALKDCGREGALQFLTDDETGGLPLELLPMGDTCAGLACPVARSLRSARREPPATTRRPRALLVPSHRPRPRLDLEREIVSLTDTLGGFCQVEVWREEHNTPESEIAALVAAADRFDVLHFCGHVAAEDGGPAFQLDGARDIRLRPQDLARTRSAPWLIWTNACGGGLGGGQASFARAWLDAGAAIYIGAATPVSDAGALTACRLFYRSLARGLPVGRSMRDMRVRMAELGLVAWATIALFGDPNARFPWMAARKDPAPFLR